MVSLNNLLISITKRLGLLNEDTEYTMDIDATNIPSETRDAQSMYKIGRGYVPMVCMINKVPVYISMRSGAATAALNKRDCIERCLALLNRHKIKISRVRIDGAGYNIEVSNFLQSRGIKFVIGADWSKRAYDMAMESTDWKKKEFKTYNHIWNAEVCSAPFMFARNKTGFRMVAMRVKQNIREKQKSTKWKLKEGYYYKFVLTNDEELNGFDLFHEYHQRGASEKNFDALKNDFGWRILPFSKLSENTVHLILSAIANNVYQAVLKVISGKTEKIKDTFRLSTFLRLFLKTRYSKKGKSADYTPDIDYQSLL